MYRGKYIMYMYFSHLKHQVSLRKIVPTVNTPLGSRIKHYRLQLNQTLEEFASDLCSISYLSKVENNQIKPSDKFLDALSSKYEVSFNDASFTFHDEWFETMIDAFFNEKLCKLPDQIIFDVDYKSKLLNLAEAVLMKDFIKAKSMYFDVLSHLKCFTDKELALFLYIIAQIFHEEGRLRHAFDTLHLFNLYEDETKLKLLIKKLKFELAIEMNNHPYILIEYHKIINLCLNKEYYHLAHQIRYAYLSYMAQFMDKDQFDKSVKDSKHFSDSQLAYLLAKHDYEHGAYQQCYERLNGYVHYHRRHYLLAVKALNKLKDKDELVVLLDAPIKSYDQQLRLIVEYLKTKYTKRYQSVGTFIRNEILKSNELADNVEDLLFWYEEGLELFKSQGFYKDATQLCQLIFKHHRQLSNYVV